MNLRDAARWHADTRYDDLLGSNDEIDAGNVKAMGNEHNFVFWATNWIGMADEDIPNVVTIPAGLSLGNPVIDPTAVHYDGNSARSSSGTAARRPRPRRTRRRPRAATRAGAPWLAP